MANLINNISFWFKNARPKALPQSILPAFLAVCLASSQDSFSLLLGILAILGVITGHLGLNLFDDYFDYKKKKTDYRENMAHEGFRARIGKCIYLTTGATSLKHLLYASCIFSAVAILIGLAIIFISKDLNIFYFMLITAIIGISYSGSPLKLSYRGLGEIAIGLIFGPLVMLGTYYASCGHMDATIVLISIPVGLLVANIVYVHSILDYAPDKKIGKRTLAVLLDNPKLMLVALALVLFTPYTILLIGVIMKSLSLYYLFAFFTLPMAVALFHLMIKYIENPQQKFRPHFWMGPMNEWKKIETAELDWFMIRWYLARNILSFFCFILAIISFI